MSWSPCARCETQHNRDLTLPFRMVAEFQQLWAGSLVASRRTVMEKMFVDEGEVPGHD